MCKVSKTAKYPLVKTPVQDFEYYINCNERGEFSADVRQGKKTVFEISGYEIFEDGYMAHPSDLEGLRDYMTDMGIMRTCDRLFEGN